MMRPTENEKKKWEAEFKRKGDDGGDNGEEDKDEEEDEEEEEESLATKKRQQRPKPKKGGQEREGTPRRGGSWLLAAREIPGWRPSQEGSCPFAFSQPTGLKIPLEVPFQICWVERLG